MITACIPFSDNYHLISNCLQKINDNSVGKIEVIVIDQGSDEVYDFNKILTNPDISFIYIRNEKNLGGPIGFKQGIDKASTDIVCIIHSDVLIHELGWNNRVEQAFLDDEKLGLAGFFGASGVEGNGGRLIKSFSNMLGKEWGSPWNHHGEHMTTIEPTAIFDGLALIFRKSLVDNVDKEYNLFGENRPPHHWYDRHISVAFAAAGHRLATIGIGFDHWSGEGGKDTAKYENTSLEWIDKYISNEWLNQNNLSLEKDGFDFIIYTAGLKMWEDAWLNKLPMIVDENYNYTWSKNE